MLKLKPTPTTARLVTCLAACLMLAVFTAASAAVSRASGTKTPAELLQHINPEPDSAPSALTPSYLKGELAQKFDPGPPKMIDLTHLVDANGTAIDMRSYLGRVVAVNFWATWCAPCKHEMPTLNKAARGLGAEGLTVLAVSIDSKPAKALNYLNKEGLSDLTFAYDAKMKTLRSVDGMGVPLTILLNKQGMEVGRLAGTADWANEEAKALFTHFLQLAN